MRSSLKIAYLIKLATLMQAHYITVRARARLCVRVCVCTRRATRAACTCTYPLARNMIQPGFSMYHCIND